jgi:hypothetical protein
MVRARVVKQNVAFNKLEELKNGGRLPESTCGGLEKNEREDDVRATEAKTYVDIFCALFGIFEHCNDAGVLVQFTMCGPF